MGHIILREDEIPNEKGCGREIWPILPWLAPLTPCSASGILSDSFHPNILQYMGAF